MVAKNREPERKFKLDVVSAFYSPPVHVNELPERGKLSNSYIGFTYPNG
jgi:hypothetical protein